MAQNLDLQRSVQGVARLQLLVLGIYLAFCEAALRQIWAIKKRITESEGKETEWNKSVGETETGNIVKRKRKITIISV